MFGRGAARGYCPGLRQRINAAFVVLSGAQGRSIIEIRPAIPLAIPPMLLHGAPQALRLVAIVSGTFCFAARLRESGEVRQDRQQKPTVPNALALSGTTHAIHAVIPIAGAHERQSMRSEAESVLQCPHAVLIQAGRL